MAKLKLTEQQQAAVENRILVVFAKIIISFIKMA